MNRKHNFKCGGGWHLKIWLIVHPDILVVLKLKLLKVGVQAKVISSTNELKTVEIISDKLGHRGHRAKEIPTCLPAAKPGVQYRDWLKYLYKVVRHFFLLLLTCSACPCLVPA